ncbi:cytochrome p450 71d10 [Quercus suber]|uniref:Cytochrome p450 71d10 n=1 Tax=Quercus suber TaxID=58331 RepID=A0AAW0JCL7_QUESU
MSAATCTGEPLKGYLVEVLLGLQQSGYEFPSELTTSSLSSCSIEFDGTRFEFIPFGAGRRMCPGVTFGLTNIELPLAQLLYHFDWELPGRMTPEDQI